MSTHRVFLSVGLCLMLVTGFVVYRDLTHVRAEHTRTSDLSRGNVPLDEIPEESSPYLEDQLLTGGPEHALLVEGESADPAFNLLAAEEDSATGILTGEAPSELPKLDAVEAVPLLTPDRRQENMAAIKQALPNVSDERLEFWLEETRDLPPEMIRDMLMLRKHFGALTESFTPDQTKKALTVDKPKVVDSDPTREMLLHARALVLQNLMNESSIGYLATELVFVEDSAGGMRLADTTLSMKLGDRLQTDRPLDFYLAQNAFLVVYDGREPRLTRYGRLVVGPDRQLQLAIEGTELIASPEIVIPEGVSKVSILKNGDVAIPGDNPDLVGGNWKTLGKLELKTVRDPLYLKPAGFGCYMTTERSGEIIDLPKVDGVEYLATGSLPASNVDTRREEWLLERIDHWLELREVQKAAAASIRPSMEWPKSHGRLKLDIF